MPLRRKIDPGADGFSHRYGLRPPQRSGRAFRDFACAWLVVVAAGCQGDPTYVGSTGETQPFADCDARSQCFIDAALSDETPERFRAPLADPALAPELVYPFDGTMLPRNLADLTFQWRRTSSVQTLFRFYITWEDGSYSFYVPCLSASEDAHECVYHAPEETWTGLARMLSGKTVTLTLSATDEHGTAVAHSTPTSLRFSPDNVAGGLYYWSSELRGMYRLVFGARRAAKYIEPGTASNPGACAGCHSLSRDGTRIAFTSGTADSNVDVNAAFEGNLTVARVDDPETPLIAAVAGTPSDSAMPALNRDGTLVLSAYDPEPRATGTGKTQLVLRETESGNTVTTVPAEAFPGGASAYFPEFAPDDSAVVVTLSTQPDSEIAVKAGSIAVLPFDGAAFGEPRIVVPDDAALFHYYPTWSPDGHWIAFVSSPKDALEASPECGSCSYNNAESRLRLVSAEGGTVYELANASGEAGLTSTWPKFAPFDQCTIDAEQCPLDSKLFFITFSSKRDYGFLFQNSAHPPGERYAQLWLSAIDISRVSSDTTSPSTDPSLPPLWLPYQDLATRNHLGFWTEKLTCSENGASCGDDSSVECEDGTCVIRVR